MKIVFFTRGKGYGHAVRDQYISEQIKRLYPTATIIIYANEDAEQYYKERGYDYAHFELQEDDPSCLKATIIKTIMAKERPEFVFFDEIIEGIRETRAMRIHCAYITNYLTDDELKILNQVRVNIIFCELSDLTDSKVVHTNIHYIGPVILPKQIFQSQPKLENNICICLGGARSKLAKLENYWLINECITRLSGYSLTIIGDEYADAFQNRNNVHWEKRTEQYLLLAQKAKMVICRGGIGTLWELADSAIYPITVPYSSRVNPMELHYGKTMENRGLARLITYDEIKQGMLEQIIRTGSKCSESEILRRVYYYKSQRDVSLKSTLLYLLGDVFDEENNKI